MLTLLLILVLIGLAGAMCMTVNLSQAAPAINCVLKYSADENTSPPVVTTVGELRTLPGPKLSSTVQKVTNHSSSVPWEEILPTLKSAGGMSCEVNFNHNDPSQDGVTGVLSLLATQPSPRRRWYLYLPDGTLLFACKGYVTGATLGPMAVDGVQLMTFDLTFTSIPSILGSTAW